MSCDVIVNIERTNLRVYYSQNKNSYKVFTFDNNDIIPFYVFSDGISFEVGEPAKIKFKNHLANSFFDFFNLVKDSDLTYTFLDGEEKQISFLIVNTIETILNSLFKKLILGKTIAELRDKISLNLFFSSDITDDEINFVSSLFIKHGYKNGNYIYQNFHYR